MRHQRGFTLIELMITVTVMGILAAVAIPSYNEYIQRSHRSNARGALLEAAQWMERAATAQGRYPLSGPVNQIPLGLVRVDGGRYQLTIRSLDGIAYQITATAQGAQMSDKCGNFTLNQAGTRNVTGTLPVNECWDH